MFGFLKKSPAQSSWPATRPLPKPPQRQPTCVSWRQRLKAGLARTRAQFGGKLKSLFSRGKVDDELLEDLEALLLSSDVGLDATQHLLYHLKDACQTRQARHAGGDSAGAVGSLCTNSCSPLEEALEVFPRTGRSSS
jgi:fused signal recognition particle receptor